jgi:transposase InsO family protein
VFQHPVVPDGREFTCWNDEVVRVAFALDCHDREIIGWFATAAGSPVR